MKIKDVIDYLEDFAPISLQEDYDNSGLNIGNINNELTNVLVSLDCNLEVIKEAISKNCNLIITHHPIIFKNLRSITGSNNSENCIVEAIKNNISIYCIHTNLDNTFYGVNYKIAEKLKINDYNILKPISNIFKLEVYCPDEHCDELRNAIFESGAGKMGNYDSCSFNVNGKGTFKPLSGSKPSIGKKNKLEVVSEQKLDFIFYENQMKNVLQAMEKSHPYEKIAHQIIKLNNKNLYAGSGGYGFLAKSTRTVDFIKLLKIIFKAEGIRHTKVLNEKVHKIAFCGGSGSFLIESAIKNKCDVFITSDLKYHDFFDYQDQICIVDIGHFESEQFTMDLIKEKISQNFSTFAVHLSNVKTNPIKYLN